MSRKRDEHGAALERLRRIAMCTVAIPMMFFSWGAGSGSVAERGVTHSRVPAPAQKKADLFPTDPCWPLDQAGLDLARSLEELRTRDARQLVWVMRNSRMADDRLTLHLAIAHAETRGRILAVSYSGAAGLAQATPIAVLSERVEGPLYITRDYVLGAEAYFLKKPLGDADTIASFLLEGGRRERAAQLLAAAWMLKREGLDELDLLAPWSDQAFGTRRARAEEENAATLERLGELIESGATKSRLKRFRDETRTRYRALRDVQRRSWRAYRNDLSERRDALLQEIYGVSEARVFEAAAYDAGEILATRLDVRFSPTIMAEFLSRHFETKLEQAREMGVGVDDLETTAIGLYNSGTPNMKRIRFGLIGSLPETDAYMRRVPGVRDRLNAYLEQ